MGGVSIRVPKIILLIKHAIMGATGESRLFFKTEIHCPTYFGAVNVNDEEANREWYCTRAYVANDRHVSRCCLFVFTFITYHNRNACPSPCPLKIQCLILSRVFTATLSEFVSISGLKKMPNG